MHVLEKLMKALLKPVSENYNLLNTVSDAN